MTEIGTEMAQRYAKQYLTMRDFFIGIMQMKNSGMTPQQALQQMAQSNPQMRQIMQGGNPQQAAMNMLKEAGVDPQQFMRQANQLFK